MDLFAAETPEQRAAIQHHITVFAATMESITLFADCLLADPIPMHTSLLRGAERVQELLAPSAHTQPTRAAFRMSRQAFLALRAELVHNGGLAASQNMGVDEMIAIYLYIVGGANSNRDCQDRFQRSPSTISRCFHRVQKSILAVYDRWVKLPDSTVIPQEIKSELKYSSYFSCCLGALDGSHIHINPPREERIRYRNRKGFLSQNVLAVTTFDLRFLFVHAGWEGSASDSSVLEDALKKGFVIPEGKYYLADAGYGLSQFCLTPYRAVRYHLREWREFHTANCNGR